MLLIILAHTWFIEVCITLIDLLATNSFHVIKNWIFLFKEVARQTPAEIITAVYDVYELNAYWVSGSSLSCS